MSEVMYFKNKNDYFKAVWDYDFYAESPRDYQDNLGTMIFNNRNSNHRLGDEQTKDWTEYFIDELEKKGEIVDYTHKKFSFKFPSPEDVIKHPFWKDFITGNSETGLYIDKPLFDQYMESCISSMKEGLINSEKIDVIGGIPLNKDQKLSNYYTLEYKTPLKNLDTSDSSIIEQAIRENIEAMSDETSILESLDEEVFTVEDDFSESELFEIWKNTKAAVLAIDVYEHSGITCYEASVRKTLRVSNDKDDGSIFNDGFIFVDKDNIEYQNELTGEARDSNGKIYNKWIPKTEEEAKKWAEGIFRAEIEDYASYLENDVHTITVSYLNKETMEWVENDSQGNILGSNLEENLENNGYSINEKIDESKMFSILSSPTKEFVQKTGIDYIEEVKKLLPEFDNSVKYASICASKNWSKEMNAYIETEDRVNKFQVRKNALNQYFAENGCSSPEKLFDFLEKQIEKKEITKGKIKNNIFKEPERER